MSSFDAQPDLDRYVKQIRGGLMALAIIAIVLGIVTLVWPDVSLLAVAELFGLYLVVSGAARMAFAGAATPMGTAVRWIIGFLGALVVIAGVICLYSTFESLIVLTITLGIGWIIEGIADMLAGATGQTPMPRWWAVVTGVITLIAGIAVLLLPGVALTMFVIAGGFLLILIGVATLIAAFLRADQDA